MDQIVIMHQGSGNAMKSTIGFVWDMYPSPRWRDYILCTSTICKYGESSIRI